MFCLFSGTETWLHCVAFAQNNTDIIKDDISSSCNRQISVHHPTSNHTTLILQNMHHLLYKKSGVITFVKNRTVGDLLRGRWPGPLLGRRLLSGEVGLGRWVPTGEEGGENLAVVVVVVEEGEEVIHGGMEGGGKPGEMRAGEEGGGAVEGRWCSPLMALSRWLGRPSLRWCSPWMTWRR